MEVIDFCRSLDFMKLGQAVNRENWQAAASVLQRMQKQATEADCSLFDRNFISLRQCLLRKDRTGAKNVLAAVIAKRTRILNNGG